MPALASLACVVKAVSPSTFMTGAADSICQSTLRTSEHRGRILRNVCERVHWATKSFPRLDIAELFARYLHGDERVKIEVRVDADRVSLLLSGGLLRLGCVHGNWH